ncbi:MAG: hypothetical protein A2V77_07175 [Anaeromyxobacter sp. RBG_16_69_14]|nr:MAG: hypothetical protein A2V77_07175 [Anaeromyxobacter sp. RBG_16_69_14]
MTLDLTCQACDASFELDLTELVDDPRVQCPSCDARAPVTMAEGLSNALDDLLGQVARLRPKFQLVFEVESDELPPPYDRERTRAAIDDDEPVEEDLEPEDDQEIGRDADD